MIYAYARVSTKEQNLDRQLEELKKYEIDKIYTEKQSGKDFNSRKVYQSLRKKLCKWYNNDFKNIRDGMTLEDLIQESLMLVYKGLFHYNYLNDPVQNSKQYRKFVYAITEKFICKKYIRDYRTKILEEDF